MLKVIQSGTGRPISYPVNPNAVFQPGMVAQMTSMGNDALIGVSDGIAPFGLIDDAKDTAFTKPVIDEVVIIEATSIVDDGYGNLAMGTSAMKQLNNAYIVSSSFTSSVPGLTLNEVNGIVTAPAGTTLNYSTEGSSIPNAVRTLVRYSYQVPNMAGEDTTLGSGRVTIWFTRGIFQTDQYEMTPYTINANLYVSSNGKFTTEQTLPNQPSVAMVLVPPSAQNTFLEFLWF
jgi:hypothetical protein